MGDGRASPQRPIRCTRRVLRRNVLCLFSVLFIGPALPVSGGPLLGPGEDDFDREIGSRGDAGRTINFELFRPPGHEAGEPLPLVVFLHGFTDGLPFKQMRLNDTMRDLVHATQRDNLTRNPTCTAPSATATCAAQDAAFAAYLLVPKIPIVEGWSSYHPLVDDLVRETMERYHVDAARLYLTGFSDGGFATVELLQANRGQYAAGVPISGGGSRRAADALKETPMWFFHGADDTVVWPTSATALAAAIEAAGGEARLTLVPGGHNAGYEFAFRDQENQFYPWMFSQSLSIPEPSSVAHLLAGIVAIVLARRREAKNKASRSAPG